MKWLNAFLLFTIFPSLAIAAQPELKNVCPNEKIPYCKEIGKDAHHNESVTPPILQGVKIGKITGVIWRPKGSILEILEAVPSKGIPELVTTSPQDAYYYLIDDGSSKPLLRKCTEIIAR
jgi:hypothetical protein